ncbi:hypothetical protein OMP38_12225 [Cohnella ginsengisoli]|uniref:Carbohydrate ABC transporter permease n=1 Tax=Cohnella ginsengisoli TaxID=425004 RepID=A0A9X4QMB2_9BACL|nr:hypothetical protein [Cohnella ginsengisoli]MDG0791553.1 hypothetical protein [Cohnella ginsengisoli]
MNTEQLADGTRHRWGSRAAVLIGILLTLYPILFVLLTSLKSTQEFFVNIWGLPHSIAWDNFPKAWIDAHIKDYFLVSTIVVVSSVFFYRCARGDGRLRAGPAPHPVR